MSEMQHHTIIMCFSGLDLIETGLDFSQVFLFTPIDLERIQYHIVTE